MKLSISHNFKKETLLSKIKWCLRLSSTERYEMVTDLADFIIAARGRKRVADHDRGSFKTIQVLKQK